MGENQRGGGEDTGGLMRERRAGHDQTTKHPCVTRVTQLQAIQRYVYEHKINSMHLVQGH